MFETISLHEPDKGVVRDFQAGGVLPARGLRLRLRPHQRPGLRGAGRSRRRCGRRLAARAGRAAAHPDRRHHAGRRSGPGRSALPGGARQTRHHRHRERPGRSLVGRQLRPAGRGGPAALPYVLLVSQREERQPLRPSDRGAVRRGRSRPGRGAAHRRLRRGRRAAREPQLRGALSHRLSATT